MAERPNAASRQIIKRPREPLADTNSVTSEAPIDQGMMIVVFDIFALITIFTYASLSLSPSLTWVHKTFS